MTSSVPLSTVSHRDMANAIRFLSIDAVEAAQSGHPGMPMGMADVATVLFRDFLNFDPNKPDWPNRDRFVLSAGHGSMLLYALLYLTGYPDMTLGEIKAFRQWGSRTAGHPEYGHATGIETTTGPLGQGLSNAVGMAVAQKMLGARFGEDLFDYFTYVIASDGDLMEGISHEALSFAGHLRLCKLIVFFDDNHISIDGPTSLAVSDNQVARFEASGWHCQAIDGHDEAAIAKAIQAAQTSDKPSLIACRTTIGYGAPKKGGTRVVMVHPWEPRKLQLRGRLWAGHTHPLLYQKRFCQPGERFQYVGVNKQRSGRYALRLPLIGEKSHGAFKGNCRKDGGKPLPKRFAASVKKSQSKPRASCPSMCWMLLRQLYQNSLGDRLT